MAIIGGVGQNAANTAYLARGQELFAKPQDGQWRLLCDIVSGFKGTYVEGGTLGPATVVEELTANRGFENVRAYSRIERVKTFSTRAVEFKRTEVEQDVSGRIAAYLQNYLLANAGFWDKIVIDKLLSNPTGMDGVALLSASHPYGASGTWDNLDGGALTQSTLKSGIAAIEGLRGENGEPMRLSPTHLIVGPALRRTALDLTGAMRPMAVGTSSSMDSGGFAAVYAENWIKGQLTVIVEQRFANGTNDNDWVLADLSPRAKPFIFAEAAAPKAVVVDDPQSEPMVQRSAYQYFIEGDAAILPWAPHGLYGTIT